MQIQTDLEWDAELFIACTAGSVRIAVVQVLEAAGGNLTGGEFHFADMGKSCEQQRPDGLLDSQEHNPALVWAVTKSLVLGTRSKTALRTPKQ